MTEMSQADRTLTSAKVRIAAMGDLHMKEQDSPSYKELFSEVSQEADILVLTGDLTDLGKPREAELLVADLRSCSIPVVGVLGNHDYECGHVEEVRAIIKSSGMHLLEGQAVDLNGVGFAGVKGFAGGWSVHAKLFRRARNQSHGGRKR